GTLGELEALEQRGGARAHPPHGYRAGEVERAAQPGEPLGLVGPHVRLETRGLGDRVDRGEVTRDALDDVEVDGQARGEVVPGRVEAHGGVATPRAPVLTGVGEAVREQVEPRRGP